MRQLIYLYYDARRSGEQRHGEKSDGKYQNVKKFRPKGVEPTTRSDSDNTERGSLKRRSFTVPG